MKKWQPSWRLLALFSLLTLLLAGCGEPYLSTLTPAGEVAAKQYDLMMLSTIIMVLVIAVVSIIFFVVIIKFRMKKGQEDFVPKQVEGSHTLEVIWTVIPIILLIVLAIPTVKATFDLADVKPMEEGTRDKNAVVVNVRASLYWWEFEYPDHKIVTGQELVVPTDERVYFNLKASDVKHSFWIPAAGGKIDTNTDGKNEFWLEFDSKKVAEATKSKGVLYGKCAELCGPSHALMDFKVKALPRAEFDKWVENVKAQKGKATTTASATEGEKVFQKSCVACHAVAGQDARPEAARTAPSLATFGDRNRIAGILDFNKDEFKNWLRHSDEIKPGNKMPVFTEQQLSDAEVDALADYLFGLKVE